MKKLMTLLFVWMFVFVWLVGCSGKTYQLPHDQFCYSVDSSQIIEINSEGKQYIISLLNKASWVSGIADCESDFIFYTQKQEIRYHADCGTFSDCTNQKSVIVSDKQRTTINMFLGIN